MDKLIINYEELMFYPRKTIEEIVERYLFSVYNDIWKKGYSMIDDPIRCHVIICPDNTLHLKEFMRDAIGN